MRTPLAAVLLLLTACVSESQPYTLIPDVPYHDLEDVDPNLQRLDVYRPLGAGPFPVVVFVHGGAWHAGDKVSAVYRKADWLTSLGVLFVSVNYRLSPAPVAVPSPDRVAFPAHPEDVGRALAFVQSMASSWGGDPGRIVLMGHSAGAHLASLVSTDPRYAPGVTPRCVVSLDTHAYDIPFYLSVSTDRTRAVYHNAFTDDPAVHADASPITFAGRSPETAFLLVRQDVPGRAVTTGRFRDALVAAGHQASEVVVDGLSHEEINWQLGLPSPFTDAVEAFVGSCVARATSGQRRPETGALEVAPNPSAGRLRVTLPVGPSPWRVRVLDSLGRVVMSRRVGDGHLDLDALPAGVYTIVARRDGRVLRRRATVVE